MPTSPLLLHQSLGLLSMGLDELTDRDTGLAADAGESAHGDVEVTAALLAEMPLNFSRITAAADGVQVGGIWLGAVYLQQLYSLCVVFVPYLTAAIRHAGGAATAMRVAREERAKRTAGRRSIVFGMSAVRDQVVYVYQREGC